MPSKQGVLRLSEKSQLFAAISRDPSLFKVADQHIDEMTFGPTDRAFRVAWIVLKRYYDTFDKLPLVSQYREALADEMEEERTDIKIEDTLESIVTLAAEMDKEYLKEYKQAFRRQLRRFLDEALTREASEKIRVSDNIREVIEETNLRVSVNASVESDQFKQPLLSKLFDKESKLIIRPTGIPWLDSILDGGLGIGEVAGHLATINTGKSTMCSQLSVSRADMVMRDLDEGDQHPFVYYFIYEEPDSATSQIFSNGADVSAATMQQFLRTKELETLSSRRRGDYKPYEEAKFKSVKANYKAKSVKRRPAGEFERLTRYMKKGSKAVVLVDLSGDDAANRTYAGMGVMGIKQYIEAHQDAHNNPGVDFVVVDYAKVLLNKYISATGRRADELRMLLNTLPLDLRSHISTYFRAPVWIAQQLSTAENSRAEGMLPDVSQGSECHSFHENCSFCFVTGKQTKDGISAWGLGKQRRIGRQPPFAMRLDGTMARWVQAKSFMVSNGQVTNRSDQEQIQKALAGSRLAAIAGGSAEGL